MRSDFSVHLMLRTAAVLAAMTMAGCTATDAPPKVSMFPPRPAIVDVIGLPTCDLLSRAQKAALGLDAGVAGTDSVNGRPSPGCTWLGDGPVDFNGQLILVDAAQALTEPGATVITVGGFGAVRSVPANSFGGTPFCQISVDAADGQTVRIQASTRPGEPPIGIDDQCRRAADAASMVMTTVVATASR